MTAKKIRKRIIPEDPSELIEAEVSSGSGSGRKFKRKYEIIGVTVPYLTDQEWRWIQSKNHKNPQFWLPSAARIQINRALQKYWGKYADSIISDPAKGLIKRSIKVAEKLLPALNKISNHVDLRKLLSAEEVERVQEACDHVASSILILERAQRKIAVGGRPSFGGLTDFIADLDRVLWQHKGIRVSQKKRLISGADRSPLDFVSVVCEIAHTTVTQSTISKAIARFVKARKRSSRT